jgi:tetratricopeptide (TPR) repeat protein
MHPSKLVHTLITVFTLIFGPGTRPTLASSQAEFGSDLSQPAFMQQAQWQTAGGRAEESQEDAWVVRRSVDYLQVVNPRVPLDAIQWKLLNTHKSYDHILVVFSDLNGYEQAPWTEAQKKTVKRHLRDAYGRVPGLLINASALGPVTFSKAGDKKFSGETVGSIVRLSDLFFDQPAEQQLYTVIHELAHAVDSNQRLSFSEEWQKLARWRISKCRADFRKFSTWDEQADCLQRYTVPSDYALSDSTELLAEYVAAVVLCPNNNCPSDVRAFIQKHVLSKQPPPDAYTKAMHRITADRSAQSFSKAESLCNQWVKRRPDDLGLLRLRMELRAESRNWAGTIADGKKVLELARKRQLPEFESVYSDCYCYLGHANFHLKNYKECIPFLDKMLASAKDSVAEQIIRAHAYLYLNRPARALKDFEAVLQLQPDSIVAQLGRARVYARMCMTEKAHAELDKLRKREHPTKEIFWQLADLESSEGKKTLADHHLRVADHLAE